MTPGSEAWLNFVTGAFTIALVLWLIVLFCGFYLGWVAAENNPGADPERYVWNRLKDGATLKKK